MKWMNDWPTKAACRGTDPDRLFVQGAAQNRAKAICFGCPVRTECVADSLDNEIEFGVWGGMTERERRALLRRRPEVVSWRGLLENARVAHDEEVTIPSQAVIDIERRTIDIRTTTRATSRVESSSVA